MTIQAELQRRLQSKITTHYFSDGTTFERKENIPRIVCKDGFSFSVQASQYHFCDPEDNFGPWTYVEVGFPSEVVDKLKVYAETDDYTNTAYGWVPIEVVAEIIWLHGGFKE